MKFIFLSLLFTLSTFSLAEIEIKVSPEKPVKGDTFNVIFKVKTQSDHEPYISFTPLGLEVLGRAKEVSLQTSMINGTFSSTKTINMVYEMVADKSRTARLNDIKVEIGGETIEHKPVSIQILSKRRTPTDIFLKADVSKESAYLGEGIDVRYYLYTRVPIMQAEVKSFPKLNGFIKRFHQVNERDETVEYNGTVYKRSLKYSARVYPEKVGNVFVDAFKLVLKYGTGRSNPFGGLGFGFDRIKSKTVSSPRIKVEVKPLPAQNVPPNFTGLVGEHEFSFSQAKQKFLVNEALEARLEVIGPGALEKLEAPSIYNSEALEKFDTKSEFSEIERNRGKKIFDYTFLARGSAIIEEKEIELAYFDPDDNQYKSKTIIIPRMEIGGSANTNASTVKQSQQKTDAYVASPELDKDQILPAVRRISAPLFLTSWSSNPLGWSRYLQYFLSIICLILLIDLVRRILAKNHASDEIDDLIKIMKKRGVSYSLLCQALFLLSRTHSGTRANDTRDLVMNSDLSQKDQNYFIQSLKDLEDEGFSIDKNSKKKIRFRSSSFKALKKEIKNAGI